MTENPDARPEPVRVVEFEGEYVRIMEGTLPAIPLVMDEGYARGTHLRLAVEVRVRNVRYDEIRSGDAKGELKRVHVLALEEVQLLSAHAADEVDPGAGGSATGSARIEETYEIGDADVARECYYDGARLEVVHRGGCELCEDRIQTAVESAVTAGWVPTGVGDPGF